MHSDFTPEDLIRHLYNETSPEEASALEQALLSNPGLNEEMQQLREAKLALDNGGHNRPSVSVLERIRAYSTEKSLQETH